MSDPTPKLHIDSDWKAQAQAEKERLAKVEEEKSKDRGPRGGEEFPPADFKSLMGMLASQALMGLGAYGDPDGRVMVDLAGSKFAIDLLGVLEEKTKGNLTPEETKEMGAVLNELRSRFVQIASLVAKQMREQGAVIGDPAAAMAAGGPGTAGRIGEPGPRRPIIETP
jgi:hypothetical protein